MVNIIARNRYVNLSDRKLRIVANFIRGKKVDWSLNILLFMKKKAAMLIRKTLYSALSNAKHNNGIKSNSLIISQIYIDKAIFYKRVLYRNKGRINYILKKTSHITIIIS